MTVRNTIVLVVVVLGVTSAQAIEWGVPTSRVWLDFNHDGYEQDFCRIRIVTPERGELLCDLSIGHTSKDRYQGQSFRSQLLDLGPENARAWVDFNGDSNIDFCRLNGTPAKRIATCTLSNRNGTAFISDGDIKSDSLGTDQDMLARAWVDFNGDGRADFCWVSQGAKRAKCVLSVRQANGNAFGMPITSPEIDLGDVSTLRWGDFNGDDRADLCGVVKKAEEEVHCIFSSKAGADLEFSKPFIDLLTAPQ